MTYATLDTLKTYLDIDTTSDDALLTTLLTAACRIIDAMTGRTFEASSDATRYYDANDIVGDTLYLREDLAQITSITNGNGNAIDLTDTKLYPRDSYPVYAIRLINNESWDTSDDIEIVGRWAYSVTAPEDIQHYTVRLAAWLYRQKDNQSDGDRVVIAPDGTALMPSRLPADIQNGVMKYAKLVDGG